jgi:hypothetical protein
MSDRVLRIKIIIYFILLGLGQGWLVPNSWEKGEVGEEEYIIHYYIRSK